MRVSGLDEGTSLPAWELGTKGYLQHGWAGVFFRTLLDRTLSFSGEVCTAGRKSKEYHTLAITVNILEDFEKP